MENHPIPQDVTGFQFKIIGDMTLKQFAYLCVSVILSWAFFSAHISPFFKIPVALFLLIFGILLAFVPFEGRPMDQMIMHFIKALFSPNQWMYEKTPAGGGVTHLQAVKTQNLATPPHQIQPVMQTVGATQGQSQIRPLDTSIQATHQHAQSQQFDSTAIQQSTPPVSQSLLEEQKAYQSGVPSKHEEELQEELKKEKEELENELKEVQSLKEEQKSTQILPQDVHTKLLDLEKKLQESLTHKQKLEEELLSLQKKLQVQQPTFVPSEKKEQPKTNLVQSVPKAMGKATGFAFMPDDPNVIIGIIKDPRGNVLPNILVEVTDPEGNSVRAFKTNAMGQFASATALKDGTYTILFEDPSGANSFDNVSITANGQILEPIEITSHDQREDLRQALFAPMGNAPAQPSQYV